MAFFNFLPGMEFLALVLLLLFSLFLFSVNGFQFWAFYFSCFNDIAIQGNSSLTIFNLRGPWQRSLPSTVTCPTIYIVKGGIFPTIWISKKNLSLAKPDAHEHAEESIRSMDRLLRWP